MVGSRQVLVDGIDGADTVGGGVGCGGDGVALVFEDQVADELRLELHNDGGSGGLLGRDGKCVGNGGVDVGGLGGGDVSTLLCMDPG
jgi:hypothetical protein